MQETEREEINKINRLMDLRDDISWAEERDSQNHVPPNDMKYMVDNCIELDEKGDLLVRVGALGGSPTARIREALTAGFRSAAHESQYKTAQAAEALKQNFPSKRVACVFF